MSLLGQQQKAVLTEKEITNYWNILVIFYVLPLQQQQKIYNFTEKETHGWRLRLRQFATGLNFLYIYLHLNGM